MKTRLPDLFCLNMMIKKKDGEKMQTSYGLPFEITDEINPAWDDYNQTVAMTHLMNFNRIYLDVTYKCPIDNEYELEDIHETYESILAIMKSGDEK